MNLEIKNPSVHLPDYLEALGSPTGAGVRIGIIDSGWDRTLSNPQIQPGVGLVSKDDDFALQWSENDNDCIGHGTSCADLINRIAPQAQIIPIRIFNNKLKTSVQVLLAAINWAIEHEIAVVNLSVGTLDPYALRPLYLVCERARRGGTIIIAARHNLNAKSFPSLFENVISVGIGDVANRYDFIYQQNAAVEVQAKGRNQWALGLRGIRVRRSATSFAAPNITGIVALFLESNPGATIEDVRALLAQNSMCSRSGRTDDGM